MQVGSGLLLASTELRRRKLLIFLQCTRSPTPTHYMCYPTQTVGSVEVKKTCLGLLNWIKNNNLLLTVCQALCWNPYYGRSFILCLGEHCEGGTTITTSLMRKLMVLDVKWLAQRHSYEMLELSLNSSHWSQRCYLPTVPKPNFCQLLFTFSYFLDVDSSGDSEELIA
jgi:hypothetical protein